MKKSQLFLTSALLFCGLLHGFAQTEKGKFLIGASSSLDFATASPKANNDFTSVEGAKTSTFEFTPGAGYFILNNLAAGVQFSINSTKEKDDTESYSETATMLLPFVVKYFGKGNVKPFVNAAVGPGWQKWGYDDKQTETLTACQLGGGLAIFVNQHISLDLSLAHVSASAKFKDNANQNWDSTSKGVGGNIGFSIIF